MGASNSKNASDSVVEAVSSVASSIIQTTQLSQDQSQVISVSDVAGNVNISGNTFSQQATVNMTALMDALSTQAAQQSILQTIAQEAKSMTSGINLAQLSNTDNTIKSYLKGVVKLVSTIGQTCSSLVNQKQSITVERVGGSLEINNNVFDQVLAIFQNCVQQAASNNSAVQSMTNAMSQKATSATEGISTTMFAFIAIAFIAFPVMGVVFGGKIILGMIGPISIVAGIVLILLYFVTGEDEIEYTPFSSFIATDQNCVGTKGVVSNSYDSPATAGAACLNDSNCKAFDWKAYNVNSNGVMVGQPTPQTTFYSSVSKSCKNGLKPDNSALFRVPKLFHGPGNPAELAETTALDGDAYLDTDTGRWYQKNMQWEIKNALINSTFSEIAWGFYKPTLQNDLPKIKTSFAKLNNTCYYISMDDSNPSTLFVYQFNNGFWKQTDKFPGPNLVPSVPNKINTSGFRFTKRNPIYLYIGIPLLIIGIFLTILMVFKNKEEKPTDPNSTAETEKETPNLQQILKEVKNQPKKF